MSHTQTHTHMYIYRTIVYLFTDSKSITSSIFLESASISLSGSSEVTVDCTVAADYPEASCVLVYRKYDNPMLTITDFPQSILPIKLNVDTPESYTFAVFGENGVNGIEEEPAFIVKFNIPTTVVQPLPSQSPSPGIYIMCNITQLRSAIVQ